MSFTGRLGLAGSSLGNIELGLGSIPASTLTVAGVSAVSLLPNNVIECSLTIAGVSAVSLLPNNVIGLSVTLAAIDAITDVGDSNSVVIPGVSAIALSPNNVINCSLIIAGIAAISETPGFNSNPSLTVHGIASFNGIISGTAYAVSITVPAIAAVTQYFTDEAHISLSGFSFFDFGILGFENPAAVAAVSTSANAVFHRTITQTFRSAQTVTVLPTVINLTETLHFTQNIHVHTIHNPSLTQTLSFSQDAIQSRNIPNTLDLIQTIVSKKIKTLTVTQTLHLISTPSRAIVSNHHVTHTLVFNPPLLIPSQIITTTGRFNYYKPNIIVTKKSVKEIVTLVAHNQIIDLPSPQFNDTQAYSGTINLKRTMTGLTYTYVKRSTLNKLHYTFNLGRPKSLELKQFLLNNSDKVLTMYNWKGEVWYVVVTSNPFEFIIAERYQREQERVDITLEFEGVKFA